MTPLLLLLLPLATLPAPAPEREARYDWRLELQKLLTSIKPQDIRRVRREYRDLDILSDFGA